jgi:hypothetical protein
LKGELCGHDERQELTGERATGVVCDSFTAALLAIKAPTITMPATMRAFGRPFHWFTNCGRPTAPPAPPTFVTWAVPISFSARITCSMVRAVWSQPPPGAAGTNSWSWSIACASARPPSIGRRLAPAVRASAVLRFIMGVLPFALRSGGASSSA